MIKTTYRIFFENIYLHLHQNKCQNIRTPPLPSYRATPTLIEGDPCNHKWHHCVTCECRGRPIWGTLYTSRKSLQHLLATGVPSCEEPWSAHEQICKIFREELPHPIKQRRDELRKINFFVSLPLRCRLLILEDSCAEWGWPDILRTIQGAWHSKLAIVCKINTAY